MVAEIRLQAMDFVAFSTIKYFNSKKWNNKLRRLIWFGMNVRFRRKIRPGSLLPFQITKSQKKSAEIRTLRALSVHLNRESRFSFSITVWIIYPPISGQSAAENEKREEKNTVPYRFLISLLKRPPPLPSPDCFRCRRTRERSEGGRIWTKYLRFLRCSKRKCLLFQPFTEWSQL